MTEKDKKIIDDSERLGIPIFVLTAKDKESLGTITDYFRRCEKAGCVKPHLREIAERIGEFGRWQRFNTGLVKLPD